ncbi:rna-binding protein, putative [Theileria annulata]|uniref:Rna-binding protein, putative n=1 Tax=Theileria annulata TaxID=5874 RepID=Q4UGS2_THEAN|nr:rna-binding protein, putative [Theileria annulata]CAI73717.1 rna-binding protein, putative [Theileria annulata]|eukprot:XP_954394.1 rna-binding protein, putative [Theileria annulata]
MENKKKIFIRGIADDVDSNLLFSAFSQFGHITDLNIPKDKFTDKNRGIAFVEYEDEEDAKHAIFNRHNSELYGRIIKVGYSHMN